MSKSLLEKKVTEIMTKNPKTLSPDTLVDEAIKLMNKQSITNYFITKKKKPIGIIHLHDILWVNMQYSIIIKSLKYFLVFLSISIFTVLIINSATQRGADQNSLITFESEEFSSTSQILTKPLFMGLDKKQQP